MKSNSLLKESLFLIFLMLFFTLILNIIQIETFKIPIINLLIRNIPILIILLSLYLTIFKKVSIKDQIKSISNQLTINKSILFSTIAYSSLIATLLITPVLLLNNPVNPIKPHIIFIIQEAIYLIICAFQEEVVFRAYLFHELKLYSLEKQILISSFIFSIVHLIGPLLFGNLFSINSLVIILFTFSAGIFLAILYAKNKNLVQITFVHFSINFIITLINTIFLVTSSTLSIKVLTSVLFLIVSFFIYKNIKSKSLITTNSLDSN